MTLGRKPFDVVAELGPLIRYARALAMDPAAAEDLVQEALVRAYANRRQFRETGDLRTWLFSILHNVFVTSLRRQFAEERRHRDLTDLGIVGSVVNAGQQAELLRVRAAFFSLPVDQRTVLQLVVIEGQSYREAAAVLGIPVGTVMSRLARARVALRRLVEGAVGELRPHLHIVGGKDEG
jgi:RNA polymerase sigma factor (sigma-70 family)